MEEAVGAVEDGTAVIPGAISAVAEAVSGAAEPQGIGRFFASVQKLLHWNGIASPGARWSLFQGLSIRGPVRQIRPKFLICL